MEQAFTANPHDADALAGYVRFLNNQDRTEDAVLVLRSADSGLACIDLLWAETHWRLGETDAARSSLEALDANDPALQNAGLELRIFMDYFEGDAASAESWCRTLLEKDPLNRLARLSLSRLLIRRGRYNEAHTQLDAAGAAYPADLAVMECRAQLLDAQGDSDGAAELGRAAIEAIGEHPPDSIESLTAAAALLRECDEPRAAMQCLQAAQRFAPADPFVILETIRLHRRVNDVVVAASAAVGLLRRYEKCPLVKVEFAEALWELRHDAEQTERLCEQAIANDPTLVAARCRLIMLSLIAGDWDKADTQIAENRAINPAHIETENLARVLDVLRANLRETPGPSPDNDAAPRPAALSALMGEILAARGDYVRSNGWFGAALECGAQDPSTLKGAGLASLRCADFDRAASLLDSAFDRNRYDVTLKNILDFLDDFGRSKCLQDGVVTVGFQPGDETAAEYAVFLARQYIQDEAKRFGVAADTPLRVQLCASPDDINVLTDGIPPCCACGHAPQGAIYFKSTANSLPLPSSRATSNRPMRPTASSSSNNPATSVFSNVFSNAPAPSAAPGKPKPTPGASKRCNSGGGNFCARPRC